MKNVFFKPWVRQNYYSDDTERKILVLGESNHCGEGCLNCSSTIAVSLCNVFTRNVINVYLNYKRGNGQLKPWMNTFTRFTNVIHGYKLNFNQIDSFWHSVIFYNYVQKALDGPRISPTREDFMQSDLAFTEILEMYKPEIVVVWGDRMWNKLPMINMSNENGHFSYNANFKKVRLVKMYHSASSKLTYQDSTFFKSELFLKHEL